MSTSFLLHLDCKFSLQSSAGPARRRRLWLAADSMSQEEWSELRALLLNAPETND
ncbi:protein YgfX [Edwardsiella tarda]|uniref:protein YgfX n=1 Tax=Edwardsiella tarda TaxID=636 RepID=UPI00351BFF78